MARYLALSDRAMGPQCERRARRDAPDLAGIGVSVLPARAKPDALAQIADLLPPGTVLIIGAARPASPRRRPA